MFNEHLHCANVLHAMRKIQNIIVPAIKISSLTQLRPNYKKVNIYTANYQYCIKLCK